jgi:hypothetical protein
VEGIDDAAGGVAVGHDGGQEVAQFLERLADVDGYRLEPRVHVLLHPVPERAGDGLLAVLAVEVRIDDAEADDRVFRVQLGRLEHLDGAAPVDDVQALAADGGADARDAVADDAQPVPGRMGARVGEHHEVAAGAVVPDPRGVVGLRVDLVQEHLPQERMIELQRHVDVPRRGAGRQRQQAEGDGDGARAHGRCSIPLARSARTRSQRLVRGRTTGRPIGGRSWPCAMAPIR